MKPPEARKAIESFMIEHGASEDIVLHLFIPPKELWQMITVVQSLKVHPEGMVGNHTLKVLQNLRVINKVTLWAALLHDVGKIKVTKEIDGKITAYGHEKHSVGIANDIFMSNDYFNDIYHEALFCIEHHMRIKHLHEMRPEKRKRLMNHKWFNNLKELAYADSMGGLGDLTWMDGLSLYSKGEEMNKYKAKPAQHEEKYRIAVLKGEEWICIGRSKGMFFDHVEFDTEGEAVDYISEKPELELLLPSLSEQIKTFRKKMCFTNTELADFLDVSVFTLANWINGRFKPSAEKMETLNRAFGIDSRDIKKSLQSLKDTKSMNAVQLAEFLEVPVQTLRQWESGKVKPSYDHRMKLERIFDMEGVR